MIDDEHQQRADERVDEEARRRLHARSPPQMRDQERERYQHRLEADVEQRPGRGRRSSSISAGLEQQQSATYAAGSLRPAQRP